jgi:hypothetical protein
MQSSPVRTVKILTTSIDFTGRQSTITTIAQRADVNRDTGDRASIFPKRRMNSSQNPVEYKYRV